MGRGDAEQLRAGSVKVGEARLLLWHVAGRDADL